MLPNSNCVLKVGDGRGFIVRHREMIEPLTSPDRRFRTKEYIEKPLVVTAAHCLPKLPLAHAASFAHERSYKLLGTLSGSRTSILAECLFVNPVADIAVLGPPDNQTFPDGADAYDELTEHAPFLRIDKARSGKGWVLSLKGRWTRTVIETDDYSSLSIDGPNEPGMSGSPILNDAGRVVGVVVVGSETITKNGERKDVRAWSQPKLIDDLPGWLLRSRIRPSGLKSGQRGFGPNSGRKVGF